MSEIDTLNSLNFAGVQNSTNPALKNKKTEKTNQTKKSKFSELLKSKEKEEISFQTVGLPTEVESMTLEEAAVFLKDAVDNAGNALAEELTQKNLEEFKKTIRQFITFVEKNNFEIETKISVNRRTRKPLMVSPSPFFSSYNLPPHTQKKTNITVINKKLDELTQEMLETQMANGNFNALTRINEIKGLIVDLLSS